MEGSYSLPRALSPAEEVSSVVSMAWRGVCVASAAIGGSVAGVSEVVAVEGGAWAVGRFDSVAVDGGGLLAVAAVAGADVDAEAVSLVGASGAAVGVAAAVLPSLMTGNCRPFVFLFRLHVYIGDTRLRKSRVKGKA